MDTGFVVSRIVLPSMVMLAGLLVPAGTDELIRPDRIIVTEIENPGVADSDIRGG